jgi:CheY-like chemotaxis protein
MDTLRKRYHGAGNKINTVSAYLSVIKEELENPSGVGPDQAKALVKKCQVMEKNLLELEEALSRIKSISYRFVSPDRDIGELVDQITLDNRDVKILVVDDEEDLCNLLKESLSRQGLAVEVVSSLEAAKRSVLENTPHILLLDLYMQEGMEGLELLRFVRQERPRVKCFVITWEYNEDVLKAVRELKPDEIMIKPVMPAQLRAKINGLIVNLER